jgi:hypothetical protein
MMSNKMDSVVTLDFDPNENNQPGQVGNSEYSLRRPPFTSTARMIYRNGFTIGTAGYVPATDVIVLGPKVPKMPEIIQIALVRHEQAHECFCKLTINDQTELADAWINGCPETLLQFHDLLRTNPAYTEEYFDEASADKGIQNAQRDKRGYYIKRMQTINRQGKDEQVNLVAVMDELIAFAVTTGTNTEYLGQYAQALGVNEKITEDAYDAVYTHTITTEVALLLHKHGFLSIKGDNFIDRIENRTAFMNDSGKSIEI